MKTNLKAIIASAMVNPNLMKKIIIAVIFYCGYAFFAYVMYVCFLRLSGISFLFSHL